MVEFKEAKNQYSKDKLGEYFSALSNEANLKGLKHAWLVVGVKNDKTIVGTQISDVQINEYKNEIAQHTSPRSSFVNVHRVVKDYEHFGSPLLLAVEQVKGKIRNLKYRYLKNGTLFPDEADQYDDYTIREALNNCIAHQDYTLGGKVLVVENESGTLFGGCLKTKSFRRVLDVFST